ncbi:MAG: hypothetical protein K2G47_10930 [Muribaculum sp.]|nr:hypothetical protein [Muribaculum sp.]
MTARHFITAAIISSQLAACNVSQEKEQQSLMEVSKQELATALAERDSLLALVKEISEGMEQIKELEKIMTIAASNPQETAGQRRKIIADIASIRKKIQERRQQLTDLEARLQNSTINNKELSETINALRIQIDSQFEEIELLRRQLSTANEHIGSLNYTVDSLNTTVTTVTGERDAAQETSILLENELNICHYIAGSKDDLKSHGIIESGFLRKTKLLKGNFDKSVFVTADKRDLDRLPLNSRKPRLLTNHPEGSYELLEENGKKTLHILDPDLFWSLTNYLVIQTD